MKAARPERGRRRKHAVWVVRIERIDPEKYPLFRHDNPLSDMKAEKRLEEFISTCARLWARTCQEEAASKKEAA